MSCADFDAKLDLYIDAMLQPKEHLDYVEHLGSCRACTESVLGYQKVRALLTTAVTDRVAAVDVSGLWERIAAQLPVTPSPVAGHVVARVAPVEAGVDSEGMLGRIGESLTRLLWPAGFPGRLGIGVATAALAFIVFSIGSSTLSTPDSTDQPRPQVADARSRARGSDVRGARGADARNARGSVRPVRIDSIEVAAGHTVSTWVKPRTRTRVIWVADADLESFGVGNASHTR
jgi:hypothetical protein